MPDMNSVKVGDEVSVWETDQHRHFFNMHVFLYRTKVTDVTKGGIYTDDGRGWARRNGNAIGPPGMCKKHVMFPNDEIEKRHTAQKSRQKFTEGEIAYHKTRG